MHSRVLYYLLTLLCAASPFALSAASYSATVDRVVDGDTVILSWDEVSQHSVRIIGIDTPEIVARNRPVECFGQEASDYARTLLERESLVTFEFDEEYDKYDRALGYIALEDGRDFGAVMISDGYAYAYRSFPHPRMQSYTTAESLARLEKRGLWADEACRTSEQSREQTTLAWQSYFTTLLRLFEHILALL